MRTALLSTYKRALTEVDALYTNFTAQPATHFRESLHQTLVAPLEKEQAPASTASSSTSSTTLMDARDLHVFLASTRTHRDLIQRYYPTTNASALDKIKLTANRVGLAMPMMNVLGLTKEEVVKDRLTQQM